MQKNMLWLLLVLHFYFRNLTVAYGLAVAKHRHILFDCFSRILIYQ